MDWLYSGHHPIGYEVLLIVQGVNYPKGLLKWADDIGLNAPLSQLKDLHTQSGDDRYIASPLLIKKVEEGGTFY